MNYNKILFALILITDIGFIAYWALTSLKVIPDEYMFKDHNNIFMQSWNWSFLPIDLLISIFGFYTVYLYKNNNPAWRSFAIISLTLTFSAGFLALSFWTVQNDYELTWWLLNGFLVVYPIILMPHLVINKCNMAQQGDAPEPASPAR
jgi:hypothetical protein